jgi:probable rRNA maturation factor
VTPIRIGPWRIDPLVRDDVARPLPISVAALGRAMALALDAAGAPAPAAIGLILSDDRELAALNVRHLGHEGPTDVLSFPLLPPEAFPAHHGDQDRAAAPAVGSPAAFSGPPGRRVSLGDVVVSVERAIEQAEAGRGGHTGDVRWSPADELRLLVTHGALHVCGWDHADPAEEREMRALESRLLASRGASARSG